MGRLLLLSALLAASLGSGACAGEPPEDREAPTTRAGSAVQAASTAQEAPAAQAPTVPASELPHGDLACAACHQGASAERELSAVPASTCTSSGCHEDAGPATIVLATVTFEHRLHGGGDPVAMECAGCHTHNDGGEALQAGTGACALCHGEQLDGDDPSDCRSCHQVPDHVGFTTQGVEVPHAGMPWVEGECVRCHYDVSSPATEVGRESCAACHVELEALVERSVGEDVHPDHTSLSCGSCHADDSHRIVAMSSAVDLACADCHVRSHGVPVEPEDRWAPTCAACHRDAHQAEQRLMLGALPDRESPVPSDKFLIGMTCRSCHVTTPEPAAAPTLAGDSLRYGSAVSCAGCHRPEYGTVLRWWREGTAQRIRMVERYLAVAEAALGGAGGAAGAAPGPASERLAEARGLLDIVRTGGGWHNLPFGHRLLEESAAAAATSYGAAGRSSPAVPDLGRTPRMGLCSYCHYRTDDRLQFAAEMNVAFHREALGLTRLQGR